MGKFCKREWLNPLESSSTGSVVAYHGESPWICDGKPEQLTILEIADCHNKVRLHRSEKETIEDFINKIEKLKGVIEEFSVYLRETKEKQP
jgi:hypothetical protein